MVKFELVLVLAQILPDPPFSLPATLLPSLKRQYLRRLRYLLPPVGALGSARRGDPGVVGGSYPPGGWRQESLAAARCVGAQ